MIESIITIAITGLLAGFIFSMPIAGPISILIASNALKGKLRYCNFVSLGASIADFTYMFIAVFGLTKLYSYYEPAIPYIYVSGCLLFFFLGYKIIRTKIDIEHLEDKNPITEKIENRERGGFYTGFMINALNPTLFIGALTSSFFVITFISSMGFHTGGLANKIDQRANEIVIVDWKKSDNPKGYAIKKFESFQEQHRKEHQPDQTIYPSSFHLLISICFAFFLSVGNIIWLFLMALLIVRFRQRININVISVLIKSLGVLLWILGIYFGFLAVRVFSSTIFA
jgi:threonine/homoserine/homoserine lactone efflux protein